MIWGKQTHAGERRDAMQEFTDVVVHNVELGVKPWERPWDSAKCAGPQAPFNPITGQPYHGVNVSILGMHPIAFQTGDPPFCTYQQGQEKDWQVKKGEKSTTIFFTKRYSIRDRNSDEDDATKEVRVLKHYASNASRQRSARLVPCRC